MLHIYNSAIKQKAIFTPIIPGKVRLYVCGMTVYDYCHIGHGRLFVVFDMVARYLRFSGYEVTYVRNITDIDDKIIHRAAENGESIEAITERFIKATEEDERALGVLPPDIAPRATAYVPQIVALIQTLLDKKYAYIAANGDVYYSVPQFADYGKFAHQTLEKLRHGARVDILEDKHDPLDFVLWKLAKPGEPTWDSPWGKGRPGWHSECSAMSAECLGKTIDIHGGGLDLVFPHHQNEIAQSEAAFDCHFVNTWMHMGYVQINSEKMSKSLHNFFTIREVLEKYDAETVRYFMLASHYRSPINYSAENLESAKAGLARLYLSVRGLPEVEPTQTTAGEAFTAQFHTAMEDDFNTPLALSVLFEMVREINTQRDAQNISAAVSIAGVLKKLSGIFGILQQDPETFLQADIAQQDQEKIAQLVTARNEARANKEWEKADQARKALLEMGIVLEDTAQGTTLRKG
jgi:cysteinyl-tRNA synthetase